MRTALVTAATAWIGLVGGVAWATPIRAGDAPEDQPSATIFREFAPRPDLDLDREVTRLGALLDETGPSRPSRIALHPTDAPELAPLIAASRSALLPLPEDLAP